MARKEKLEDVNIMDGIDFIKNQNRMKRINARIKREQRLYKLLYVLVILALLMTTFVAIKTTKQRSKCNTDLNKNEMVVR